MGWRQVALVSCLWALVGHVLGATTSSRSEHGSLSPVLLQMASSERLVTAAQLGVSSGGGCSPGEGHSCCAGKRCPFANGVCCPSTSTCCPASGRCMMPTPGRQPSCSVPRSSTSCPCATSAQNQESSGGYVPTCRCATKDSISAAAALKIRELKEAQHFVDKRISTMKALKHELQERLLTHLSNAHNLPDIQDQLETLRRQAQGTARDAQQTLKKVRREADRRIRNLRQKALEQRVKAIEAAKRKHPLKSVVLVLNDNAGHKDGAHLPADGDLMRALASTGVLPSHLAAAALLGNNSSNTTGASGHKDKISGAKQNSKNNQTSASEEQDPMMDPGHPSRAHRDADAHQDGIASWPALGSAAYLHDLHTPKPKGHTGPPPGKPWSKMKEEFKKVVDKAKESDKAAQDKSMRFRESSQAREHLLDLQQDELEKRELAHLQRIAAYRPPAASHRKAWGDTVRDPKLRLARAERFLEATEKWKEQVDRQSDPEEDDAERKLIINLVMPKQNQTVSQQQARASAAKQEFHPARPPKTFIVCLLVSESGALRSLVRKDRQCQTPERNMAVRTLWYADRVPTKDRVPFCARTNTDSNSTSSIVAGTTSCAGPGWNQDFVFYSPQGYVEGSVPMCVRESQSELHKPVIITDLYTTQCGSATPHPMWKQLLSFFVFPGETNSKK